MTRTRALLLVGIAAFGVGAICGESDQRTEPSPDVPTAAAPERTKPSLPDALSVSRISDWDEAERVVGYHPIPRSPTFPLTWPYLFIQPAIGSGRSSPRIVGALYTVDAVGVKLTVAPVITWGGAATLEQGQSLTIGTRTGWLSHRGSTSSFAFRCAESADFGEVWCQVETDSSPPDLLTRFVSDLTP